MNYLSWNCRGLGNPQTVHELHLLVLKKSPAFVFLMETKCSRNRIESLKKSLKLDNSFVIDCKGRKGGLAFLWRDEVEAVVHTYTQHHISLMVKGAEGGKEWLLTGFYGNPNTSRRKESWQLLQAINPGSLIGWVCVGDFNEILNFNEKWGGALRPKNQIDEFRAAVDACGLCDMDLVGNKFTWNNGRSGGAFTKERLDRAFCNSNWSESYPNSNVCTLSTLCSDHCPLLVRFEGSQDHRTHRDRPFRFEAHWAMRDGYQHLMEEIWQNNKDSGNKVTDLKEGLNKCKQKLLQWDKRMKGNSQQQLSENMTLLDDLQKKNKGHLNEQVKQVQKAINNQLEEDNLRWKQRAKQKWLREGDRNTRFFHQSASFRRRNNNIKKLVNEEG
ncbi:hypothetical protein F2P56_007452 [Juglans regia]|uniref:Uncharacterized protein LOC108999324 n=2 Tax=Juglans regia TaxID=51240 RepID=A0A2I4FJD0_JUGRE|nr:uncharacterized protein LOC108999324 [Juglans regia]KAF5475672.1 hypothetical protein F2P56_007452 [Juglans regia]